MHGRKKLKDSLLLCNIPAVMGPVQSLQEASMEYKLSQICRKFTILGGENPLSGQQRFVRQRTLSSATEENPGGVSS